jgi:type II secretion system protein D
MKKHFCLAVFGALLIWGALVPLAAQEEAPAGQQGMSDSILLPNNSIQEALEQYERISGKILIKEANLEGNISIQIPGPIANEEALKLLEGALLLNRIAIIPNDERSVKVVNVGSRNPRSEAIPFYASLEDVPNADLVVSLFMPLRFLTPEDAERIFRTQVQFNEYGTVVPVPNAKAVIVTENAKVVRSLARVRALIDVPPEPLIRKFVILERADAEKVVESIKQMLDERAGRSPRSGVTPQGAPQAIQGAGPGATPASPGNLEMPGQDFSEVQLLADARTNRILVVATKQNFASITELIREFDAASAVSDPFTYRLRYVLADEVLPVLQTVLSEGKEEAGQPGGQTGAAAAASATAPSTGADSLSAPQERNPPRAIVVGRSRVIADPRAGTIAVFGPPEAIAKAKEVLLQLDQRPEQVYLATVIGEMANNNNLDWTIDLVQNFQRTGDFGLASSVRTDSPPTALIDPRLLRNAALFPLNPGLSLYGSFRDTLNATVNLLEGTGRFKILSKPSVFAKNNRMAIIEVGEQIPVPTSTVSSLQTGTTENTAISSNIDFRDVALRLEVIPQINANREVTLNVLQRNDRRGADTVIAGNTIPNINSQFLTTEVTVPDRSTILLGGLVRDISRKTTSGLPWISSIPLLGYLFKSESNNREMSELVVLIQPVVVTSKEEELEYNQTLEDRSAVTPAAKAFMEGQSPVMPKKPSGISPNRAKVQRPGNM